MKRGSCWNTESACFEAISLLIHRCRLSGSQNQQSRISCISLCALAMIAFCSFFFSANGLAISHFSTKIKLHTPLRAAALLLNDNKSKNQRSHNTMCHTCRGTVFYCIFCGAKIKSGVKILRIHSMCRAFSFFFCRRNSHTYGDSKDTMSIIDTFRNVSLSSKMK